MRAPAALAACLLFLLAGVAAAAPGTRYRVGPEGAALLAEPAEGAAVLAELSAGARLVEFRREGAWVKVAVFGEVAQEGWVRGDRIVAEPQAPAATPPPEEASPVPSPPEPPEPHRFVLAVEGPVARSFQGSCRLLSSSGAERAFDLEGLLPESYSFEGRWMRCSFFSLEARHLELQLFADGRLLDRDRAGLVLLDGGAVAQGRASVSAPRAWR